MNESSTNNTSLISLKNYEMLEKRVLEHIMKTEKCLLIGTFNLQNLKIKIHNNYVSLSDILIDLVRKGLFIAILTQPNSNKTSFVQTLNERLGRRKNFLVRNCPRLHLKTIIIDFKIAYIGSANLTGFGLGTRSIQKRNFELGFITTDKSIIYDTSRMYLDIITGTYCNQKFCHYFKNKDSKRYCTGIQASQGFI